MKDNYIFPLPIPPKPLWKDYVGRLVHARFAVERNVDGCDVPVIQEKVVRVLENEGGEILLDCEEWDEFIYPFDDDFEFITD